MRSERLADLLNAMANLFHLGFPPPEDTTIGDFYYTNSDYPLRLMGPAREEFVSCVDDLLNNLTSVEDAVSRDFLIEELVPLIREKKIQGTPFGSNDADRFKQTLSQLQLQQYRVLRPIQGIVVAADKLAVEIGDFKIDFGHKLLAKAADTAILSQPLKPELQNKLFIECVVHAKESGLASKLADALFYRFELIFRFLIGARTDRVEVGIMNYRGAQMRDLFVYSPESTHIGQQSSWQGALQPFHWQDSRFPGLTPPLKRLFELITRATNDLERHILRCAEWTGQALEEPNEAAALVKAAIALEVLFNVDEKGPITPSVMTRIAEGCAFLLGGETNSPLEIEGRVKRLYGVRSAVVHSGKDSVEETDLNVFISICRRVVIVLLSEAEYKNLESIAKLSEYLRRKKYAVYGVQCGTHG
jgi:hypothetical protein